MLCRLLKILNHLGILLPYRTFHLQGQGIDFRL